MQPGGDRTQEKTDQCPQLSGATSLEWTNMSIFYTCLLVRNDLIIEM